jgi:hypothetical protein
MPGVVGRGAILTAPSEDYEQMLFVQWFKRTYPTIKFFSIPNGGHRHIAVAAKMKATGQSPGVPDLHIPAWNLWIEFKRIKGGTVSPAQKDWISYLEGIGHTVIIGRGFENAREQVIKKAPSGA